MGKKKSIEPAVAQEVIDTEETPVEETPVEETPVDETPVDETPVDETPVDETPVDETPVDETPVDETPVEEKPKSFTITLQGPKNQSLDYGINGVFAKLPCGVEIVVSESVYNAVKAHVVPEER